MRKHFIKAKHVEQRNSQQTENQQTLKSIFFSHVLLFSTVGFVILHHLRDSRPHFLFPLEKTGSRYRWLSPSGWLKLCDLCTNVNTNKVHTKFIHWLCSKHGAPWSSASSQLNTLSSLFIKFLIGFLTVRSVNGEKCSFTIADSFQQVTTLKCDVIRWPHHNDASFLWTSDSVLWAASARQSSTDQTNRTARPSDSISCVSLLFLSRSFVLF